jgi:hypothetical protein
MDNSGFSNLTIKMLVLNLEFFPYFTMAQNNLTLLVGGIIIY